jgi:hypothetical protein
LLRKKSGLISFIIPPPIKYLGINQSKEMKGIYNENCKTLKREIKDTQRWKDLPRSWIDRINIVKNDQITNSMQFQSRF